MNKEELIDAIAKETENTKTESRKFLDAYVKVVSETLSQGHSIQLVGFAGFSVVTRKARIGRNPQTGAELKIPASKVVKFTVGKQLKELVNHGKVTKKPAAKKK